MPEFDVQLVAGDGHELNGSTARRRVVLRVGGDQKLVEMIGLDSATSVDRAASRWAEQFGVESDAVAGRLREIGISVVAEAAERQAAKPKRPKASRRVSDLADEFLQSLGPVSHRKRRAIYCERVGAEITVGNFWTHATDREIDQVGYTVEGEELFRSTGDPPDYRKRLGLFKDALSMATARLIKTLPPIEDVDVDPTVDRDELLRKLRAWLLKGRSFRADTGTPVSLSFHQWAHGVEPGSGWQRCFVAPVFGRINDEGGFVEIAVQGDHLAGELRAENKRRLAADLRHTGLAETDFTLRVTLQVWRAWLLRREVLDSIATPVTAGGVT